MNTDEVVIEVDINTYRILERLATACGVSVSKYLDALSKSPEAGKVARAIRYGKRN